MKKGLKIGKGIVKKPNWLFFGAIKRQQGKNIPLQLM